MAQRGNKDAEGKKGESNIKITNYRLNPDDGGLERQVEVQKIWIWVTVLPTTQIPCGLFRENEAELTWRRYAFERAHMTFLEPHRPSGPT